MFYDCLNLEFLGVLGAFVVVYVLIILDFL